MSWDSDPDGLRDYVDEGGETAGIIVVVMAVLVLMIAALMDTDGTGFVEAVVILVVGLVACAVIIAAGLAVWAILAAIVGYLQTDFHDDFERWTGRD